MDDAELRRRFPGLDVRARPPRLFRVNGCGIALYFSRDLDVATATYVKTLCVTFLFIPVFPLAAYRVADARNGGWFVVGRVPPSDAMRLGRTIAAAAVLVGAAAIAWGVYTDSDAYKDGVALAQARAAAQVGSVRDAASRFRALVATRRGAAKSALDGLRGVVDAVSASTSPQDARAVLLAAHDPGGGEGPALPDLWQRATKYASDPARLPVSNQVEILTSLGALAPDAAAAAAERRRLVERGAAASPPDVWAVSELAADLDAHGDAAGAEALLAPHAARLSGVEGARILGQIRAAQGRFDEAFPLLDPYVTARLGRLHTEAEAFKKAADEAQQEALDHLRSGGASNEWYERHKQADEAAKARMVSEAVAARIEKDDAFIERRAKYREAARVVPVAMDLGIVRMQRGRAMHDPAAERRELEAAERVFTAIDGVAAGDPEYEFAAARVAFWLGKKDACDAHLAAALKTAGETFEARSKVAQVLASLGESAGARKQWEAAFAVAKSKEERSVAAYAVSVNLRDDPDAALAWIRKADTADPSVAAATAECEGRVALIRGDFKAAERALAASLAAYDRLPRNSVTLNNAALTATQLSSLTGSVETLVDAGRRLRDALSEMPSNVVVIMNTAQTLTTLGWVRGMDGALDMRLGVQGLREIRYDDAAGLEAIRAKARASDEMRDALRLLDRGIGLVPGNAELVDTCADLADNLGDVARLRELVALVASHPPDTAPGRAAYLAWRERADDPGPSKGVLATVQAHLDSLGPDTDGRDRAVVEVSYIQAAGHASLLGVDVDVRALDARARRLHAQFPSTATRIVERITAALLVHRALLASNVRYAREAKRTVLLVGPEPLLAEALYRDESLRDVVRTSADFKRLVDLIEETDRKFPGELAGTSRALLWIAGRRPLAAPGAAADVEPDWALENCIRHVTSPYASRTALVRAWTHRIAGSADRADAVLRECARLGGAVPYLE